MAAKNHVKPARFYVDKAILDSLGILLSDPTGAQTDHVRRILVPTLVGTESKDVTDTWIKCFGRWAAQESLSEDLTLLFATEHMQRTDYSWAHQFCEGHTWEDFVRRYFQRSNSSDVQVAQEVERFMAWFRSERRVHRRKPPDAVRYSPRELAKATDYFSERHVIGEGRFGTLYQCSLLDNCRPVAVKRLNLPPPDVLRTISSELELISQCRHPHLLKLIGWCLTLKDRPLLVYEYLPNGNLREHLDGLRGLKLNWGTRMKIAIEVAQALTYLHSSSNIIHEDLKSTNIHLDEHFSSKVADFGISRCRGPFSDWSMDPASLSVGTPGYVDPHYLQNFELTAKSDVYSFGVVLLELVSGLQVVDTRRPRNKLTLVALAISKAKNYRLSDIFDPYLIQTGAPLDLQQWKKVALLAVRCVRMEPEARPSAKEALDTLRELRPSMFVPSHSPTGALSLSLARASRKALPAPAVECSLKSLASGNKQRQNSDNRGSSEAADSGRPDNYKKDGVVRPDLPTLKLPIPPSSPLTGKFCIHTSQPKGNQSL